MSFEIIGQLHKVFDVESKTPTFQAREFVMEKEDRGYKQYIKFQLTQDRCNIIDDMKEGDMIKVHFDLRGREWQGKYFTNLNAWRVEPEAGEQNTDMPPDVNFPDDSNQELPAEDGDQMQGDIDDLPF